ncbi:hypothetical protein ISF_02196 [Cordyceps fumosorosea ARSEF 2679]|uniref:Uncharacterized protein n=1 Tax=Cordyceps fumosorosea (strain ARSEF 2679) TaxID=1081104 RepID=A0A168CPV1_CORFA|nr:hypothetical protein ISF_02196 [Cordyceps fumosorosea ARSEF 2679]OAA71645.1 hypothetical protein ISF_02196 [Cordyceps fumosorosea ARSEF 2679]
MSSSITIQTRRTNDDLCTPKTMSSSSDSSYSDSPSSAPSTPSSATKTKGLHTRRPSLLSSALSMEKSTVINIGDPDGPPRLITYLSSSQGFDWNPGRLAQPPGFSRTPLTDICVEIFLPSYLDCDYVPLENRREPVHEIRLSEEELRDMLPQ